MTLEDGFFFVLAFNDAGFEGVFFALTGDCGGVGNATVVSVLMRTCLEMISSICGAIEFLRFFFDAKLDVDSVCDTGDAVLSACGAGLSSLCRLSGDFSGDCANFSVFTFCFGGGVVAFLFGF